MSRLIRIGSRRPDVLMVAGILALTFVGSGVAAQSPSPTAAVPDACAPVGALATLMPGASPSGTTTPPAASLVPVEASTPSASALPLDTSTPEPDTGAGTTHGDVPDNAVFLTYHDAALGFSIQYVEGWQVTPAPDGVTIRDKDSSETVRVAPMPADLAGCLTAVELPALQVLEGFSLIGQDRVKVDGHKIDHLAYHLPAPPDPVTGKRVPSTVDRYYVPGLVDMAVVSLSTPDGVDNVDAFRQMIKSLSWR